ncbi:uncharacterized protein BDV17DRAFT_257769 [Aspergillus undulatus]|uniref:uncharacterized protein n=1 Tax=Aspergillus undulatus TaxID=1810928 RepID=UPI003CCDC8CF
MSLGNRHSNNASFNSIVYALWKILMLLFLAIHFPIHSVFQMSRLAQVNNALSSLQQLVSGYYFGATGQIQE